MPWIHALDFDQVNVDLIAGMVGETWPNWRQTVQKTIELDPDSVTVYQMELPYNTVYSKDLLAGDGEPLALADWKTKRAWHAYAFEQLSAAGYVRSSAYTMKKTPDARFVYRDAVWTGQDMIGTGVASFSHLSGVHYQNAPNWDEYLAAIDRGDLPIHRAFATNREEQLTREVILQLKLGALDTAYFRTKFRSRYRRPLRHCTQRPARRGHAPIRRRRDCADRRGPHARRSAPARLLSNPIPQRTLYLSRR